MAVVWPFGFSVTLKFFSEFFSLCNGHLTKKGNCYILHMDTYLNISYKGEFI